jgi:hypothetical protein
MCEHAEQDLLRLRERLPGGQGSPQPPLEARDGTLDLPALPIERSGPRPLHLAPIARFRPPPPGVAPIERDHGTRHAQAVPAEPVIVLAIVARIAQDAAERQQVGRLAQDRAKLRRVLTRPGRDHRAEQIVRGHVTHQGQLGPATPSTPTPAALGIVGTDVVRLEPGGVDHGYRPRAEEPTSEGPMDARPLEPLKGPPFSSRRAA